MFKKIWAYIKTGCMTAFLFVGIVFIYLFSRNRKAIRSLNKTQKAAEKAAEEKYEEMSNDDIVDELANANDIRNTDGGTIRARTLFRHRSKSLLSRFAGKGIRREDMPGSGCDDPDGVSAGED